MLASQLAAAPRLAAAKEEVRGAPLGTAELPHLSSSALMVLVLGLVQMTSGVWSTNEAAPRLNERRPAAGAVLVQAHNAGGVPLFLRFLPMYLCCVGDSIEQKSLK